MPSRKNILKKLDYERIKILQVEFMSTRFDSDVSFVLPFVATLAMHSKAKSIQCNA